MHPDTWNCGGPRSCSKGTQCFQGKSWLHTELPSIGMTHLRPRLFAFRYLIYFGPATCRSADIVGAASADSSVWLCPDSRFKMLTNWSSYLHRAALSFPLTLQRHH